MVFIFDARPLTRGTSKSIRSHRHLRASLNCERSSLAMSGCFHTVPCDRGSVCHLKNPQYFEFVPHPCQCCSVFGVIEEGARGMEAARSHHCTMACRELNSIRRPQQSKWGE